MVAREAVSRHGMLPTPALPDDLPKVDLTDNARQVLIRRYVRRGDDGRPAESVEEMFWRVAYHVAKVEQTWGEDPMPRAREFYILLTGKKFFPNSPTFTGAGTPLGQLAACFVLPITDDMGRDTAGIFQSLRDAALIQGEAEQAAPLIKVLDASPLFHNSEFNGISKVPNAETFRLRTQRRPRP